MLEVIGPFIVVLFSIIKRQTVDFLVLTELVSF